MDEQRGKDGLGGMLNIDGVCHLMGDISVSTAYTDPEIRARAIPMSAPGKRVKIVRWLPEDILELRQQRIERARQGAEMVRQEVVAQNERRRKKQTA